MPRYDQPPLRETEPQLREVQALSARPPEVADDLPPAPYDPM